MHIKRFLTAFGLAAAIAATSAGSARPAPTTEWADKTVPIEVFGQFPSVSGAEISPGGTWLAAKIRSHGVQVLAILPLGTPGASPKLIARDDDFDTDKLGDREIFGWEWIDDENLLIAIRSRDNIYGTWYDNTRIAAYNRVTAKTTPLGWENAAGQAGDVLWRSPPGTPHPHLLLQRQARTNGTERMFQPEVIDVDVETGKFHMVVRANPVVNDWSADSDGVVRLGVGGDRETGKLQIIYRRDANAAFETIVRQKQDMFSDTVVPSLFLHGSNRAYAFSNHEGFRALYDYDLDKMALGKKLFGIPGYDIGGASLTADHTALEAITYVDQRRRATYFEPRLKEIQDLLEESYGKGNVRIASTDLKREKIVFSVAEMGQAPALYLFDTVSGQVGRIAWLNDTLKDARLNPVSVVRYPASDGLSIEAVLTMPRHRAGQKNLPLIVMPHGGPWARDSADWDPYLWAQALAEYGYVVIQPNYRGSTGYGKAFGKAVDGNWGNRMQDDLNDAITWLAKQGIADPKRVCMLGWSYGGYAASRAAQRDGDKYRCTISGAGVHDLPAMRDYDAGFFGAYSAKTGMGAASDNLRAASPSLNAAQFSTPILIVHGARDQRVPVSQSRNLVSRLKAAGKVEGRDFVYLEQPLNTHNLLREEDRIEFLRAAKKFLDTHNPA